MEYIKKKQVILIVVLRAVAISKVKTYSSIVEEFNTFNTTINHLYTN